MSIQLQVDIDGVDSLLARLDVAPEVLMAASTEAMTKSVFLVEAAVRANTPRVTGRLFSSIHGDVRPAPLLAGRISTSVSYAPFVEMGRGPISASHLTPSGKPGFLRFRGASGIVFRRRVGPAIGRFMFRAGLIAAGPEIRRAFREAARRVAESIRGK